MEASRPKSILQPAVSHAAKIVAVVVTRDRPALLQQCLQAVLGQSRPPEDVVVIDNASGPETSAVLGSFPGVHAVRLAENIGGAGGYRAGLGVALERGADWLWVMDDDGRPADALCLEALVLAATEAHALMVGPLVLDVDRPERLSFPIRIAGRTRFMAAEVAEHGPVQGFAHLFNGALISRHLLERIGLPDQRFFIRGDEVEFLYRARRAQVLIVLEPRARFLHPGSSAEIFPILGGRYHAVVPVGAVKQFHQFRNRGYIFRHYGMWGWLAADLVRYGCYFLLSRRGDVRGFAGWAVATLSGVHGRFMRDERGSGGGRIG